MHDGSNHFWSAVFVCVLLLYVLSVCVPATGSAPETQTQKVGEVSIKAAAVMMWLACHIMSSPRQHLVSLIVTCVGLVC